MAALTTGATAPDFTLKTTDGKKFSLKEALAHGPVVAAFFKVSCPVCQYAFPYLQRIHQAYGSKGVTIVGVSQDNQRDTNAFLREYGITFTVLLDDTNSYPVSNAYRLTNVPTVFWITPDGKIEVSSVGWSRQDIESVHRKAGEAGHAAPIPLFKPAESIQDFRPG